MLCKDIFVDFDGDISPLSILLDLYRSEHDSPQKRDEWETYYKIHHPAHRPYRARRPAVAACTGSVTVYPAAISCRA